MDQNLPCTIYFHQSSRQELGPQFSSIIIAIGKFVNSVDQRIVCPHNLTFISLLKMLIVLVKLWGLTKGLTLVLGLLLCFSDRNLRFIVHLSSLVLVVAISIIFESLLILFSLSDYQLLLIVTDWSHHLCFWVQLVVILFHWAFLSQIYIGSKFQVNWSRSAYK